MVIGRKLLKKWTLEILQSRFTSKQYLKTPPVTRILCSPKIRVTGGPPVALNHMKYVSNHSKIRTIY